ncbi:MAG: hypothetical protein M3072_16070 [Candidatus Dormibacteraeota bacterium]|nr:hypothetical protein [Candidatus Dormibacteraeota bacterium]
MSALFGSKGGGAPAGEITLSDGGSGQVERLVEHLEVMLDRRRTEGVHDHDGSAPSVVALGVERCQVVGLLNLRGLIAETVQDAHAVVGVRRELQAAQVFVVDHEGLHLSVHCGAGWAGL